MNAMAITSDQIGAWTTVEVNAPTHDRAVADARRSAKRRGFRVLDIAAATRQSGGHRWLVELQVEPR